MAELRFARLDKLLPLPRNPRKSHRLTKLQASIVEHGYAETLTVNARTGHVLAGNGRLKSLAAIRRAKQPPPANVRTDTDGEWLVPALYGDWPEEQEGKVALALNGGVDNSLCGELDQAVIAQILADAQPDNLAALGISATESTQYQADYEAPHVPPILNLAGLERVKDTDAVTTVKLHVTEELAQRIRTVTGRGVPIEALLLEGVQHHERAHDDAKATRQKAPRAKPATEREGSAPSPLPTGPAAPRGKAQAGRVHHPHDAPDSPPNRGVQRRKGQRGDVRARKAAEA